MFCYIPVGNGMRYHKKSINLSWTHTNELNLIQSGLTLVIQLSFHLILVRKYFVENYWFYIITLENLNNILKYKFWKNIGGDSFP